MSDRVLKCPKCGKTLIFVRADGQWRFYWCPQHRTVVLPPPPPDADPLPEPDARDRCAADAALVPATRRAATPLR